MRNFVSLISAISCRRARLSVGVSQSLLWSVLIRFRSEDRIELFRALLFLGEKVLFVGENVLVLLLGENLLLSLLGEKVLVLFLGEKVLLLLLGEKVLVLFLGENVLLGDENV